jgi:hypothetical protein
MNTGYRLQYGTSFGYIIPPRGINRTVGSYCLQSKTKPTLQRYITPNSKISCELYHNRKIDGLINPRKLNNLFLTSFRNYYEDQRRIRCFNHPTKKGFLS